MGPVFFWACLQRYLLFVATSMVATVPQCMNRVGGAISTKSGVGKEALIGAFNVLTCGGVEAVRASYLPLLSQDKLDKLLQARFDKLSAEMKVLMDGGRMVVPPPAAKEPVKGKSAVVA